jgi:diaminopimelate epimerase
MGKKIRFTKMHGAGNDYIYVNTLIYNIENPAELSVELSRPHFSIGSDGLILIGKADRPDADFSMRIFNNDGSEAMMCGNGTRCVAKYLHDKGLTDKNPIRLQTLSGVKVLTLHLNGAGLVETVTVDMGEAMLKDADDEAVRKYVDEQYKGQTGVGMTLTAGDRSFLGTFVSMGNPHFVIFLDDEDVETFPLEHYGRLLEHHEVFPQRCNIEFANVLPDGTIRMRVWERGSGITLACGTGACATAVAASLVGVRDRQSDVQMDGGKLHIEWDALTNHVMMTGPAAISFEGEVEVE